MNGIVEKSRLYCTDLWRAHVKPAFIRDWDLLAVIVGLALALRLYFAFVFDGNLTLGFAADFRSLAESGGIGALDAPLYPLFIRAVSAVAGSGTPAAVFAIQGVLSSAGILLVYFIASRLCGRKTGLIAASICAVYPDFILYNLSTTPGSFEVFLVLAITASCVSAVGERSSASLSAAILAAGILLDPVMAFLLPGTLIASRKRRVFLVVLAVLLLPWTVRNSIVEGRPVPVYAAAAYRIDLEKFHPGRVEGRWLAARRIYENASQITGRGWGMTGDSSGEETRNSTYAAGYAHALIMIAGLIGLARRYRKAHLRAVAPAAACTALLILFTGFAHSFRILIEPILVIYAGALAGGCRPESFSGGISRPGPAGTSDPDGGGGAF